MTRVFLLNLFALYVIVSVSAIQKESGFDYCNPKQTKCPAGTKHTGCNNPKWNGGWGKSCRSPKYHPLSKAQQQKIADIHNVNRNKQALGKVSPHYKPAIRMAKMATDPNLCNMAELHARDCEFKHDDCRNTKTYWLSGQNIAIESSTAPWTPDAIDKQIVDFTNSFFTKEWPNGKYYNWMDAIYGNYTKTQAQNDKVFGHWTEYVQDINQAVGCALVEYLSKIDGSDWHSLFFVCNYAFTNFVWNGVPRPVYVPGPPASRCKARDTTYPGLCAIGQKYFIDKNEPYP